MFGLKPVTDYFSKVESLQDIEKQAHLRFTKAAHKHLLSVRTGTIVVYIDGSDGSQSLFRSLIESACTTNGAIKLHVTEFSTAKAVIQADISDCKCVILDVSNSKACSLASGEECSNCLGTGPVAGDSNCMVISLLEWAKVKFPDLPILLLLGADKGSPTWFASAYPNVEVVVKYDKQAETILNWIVESSTKTAS